MSCFSLLHVIFYSVLLHWNISSTTAKSVVRCVHKVQQTWDRQLYFIVSLLFRQLHPTHLSLSLYLLFFFCLHHHHHHLLCVISQSLPVFHLRSWLGVMFILTAHFLSLSLYTFLYFIQKTCLFLQRLTLHVV